jgi:hypothetical protein
MRRIISITALFVSASIPGTLSAQRAEPAGPTPASCTYDTCALRVDASFFSDARLIRGLDGTPVNLGFRGRPLIDAMASVPDAQQLAMKFSSHRTRSGTIGFLTTLVSTGLAVAWYDRTRDSKREWSDPLLLGSIGASAVGGIWAGVEGARAKQALSRAVWIYNRSLPR